MITKILKVLCFSFTLLTFITIGCKIYAGEELNNSLICLALLLTTYNFIRIDEDKGVKKIKIKYHDKLIPKINKIVQGDLIDLYSSETVVLKAGESKIIKLGVSMKLPKGYKAILYPRSSTFKKWGITLVNSVGQIDNSYSGNDDIWGFYALAHRDTIINKGDKICQFEIVPIMPPVNFIEVDNLDNINLTEKEIITFKLYYLEDLSTEEISKKMGSSVSNIKYYLYSARNKIKERYNG